GFLGSRYCQLGFINSRGGALGHQGEGSARARRTRAQPHAGAARVALTAINRRRKNETAQKRNTRDPERHSSASIANASEQGVLSTAAKFRTLGSGHRGSGR